MPHTLRTEHLLLRPTRLRDAKAVTRVFADFEVTKTTGTWPHPVTEEMVRWRLRQWLAQRAPDQFGFSILYGEDVVGQIGVNHRCDGVYSLGYTIGRAWWGRGFGTEATRAFCDYAFRVHRVRAIEAEIFTGNPGSIAVAAKSGFRKHRDCGLCWSTALGRHLPSVIYRRDNPRPV